jgi:CheY-like chemotaxis protein
MNQAVEILLVEDNPDDADLVIRALKKNNLAGHILHLKDGEEALEFIFGTGRYANRNIKEMPKVIILDLKMPKVDGLEVLHKIKTDERTKAIPVVIMTSSKEERDIIKGYHLGANSYIVKPVNFPDFSRTVSELGSYWLLTNQKIPC